MFSNAIPGKRDTSILITPKIWCANLALLGDNWQRHSIRRFGFSWYLASCQRRWHEIIEHRDCSSELIQAITCCWVGNHHKVRWKSWVPGGLDWCNSRAGVWACGPSPWFVNTDGWRLVVSKFEILKDKYRSFPQTLIMMILQPKTWLCPQNRGSPRPLFTTSINSVSVRSTVIGV